MPHGTVADWKRRLALGALLLLVIAVTYPGLFAHFSTRLPYAHMDTVSYLGAIHWQNHFLLREPGLIFNLGTFYPHSLATYFGPPVFGVAPCFALFALLGLNLYAQFNLFIVLTLLLGAAGVFLLALDLSGPERAQAFVAAATYIVFNTQRSLLVWVPLFMAAFVPWILVFFFRYLKGGRRKDLLLFLLASTIQFVISAYLGVYLLALFLPWLVLFALLFRALSLKRFLLIAAGVAVVAAIVLALHFPIITSFRQLTSHRSYHPVALLNVGDLFTANRSFLYGQLLKMHRPGLFNWFPGITVTLLFFLSGFPRGSSRRWPWIAFIVAAVAAILLLLDTQLALATLIYFSLLALLVASHVRQRRQSLPLALLALGFASYVLFFFNLRTLGLQKLMPYSLLAAIIPYFQRMCEYKRVFVILVPVMAVLAAHGLGLLSRGRRWLPLLALGLIWLENARPQIGSWGETFRWDDRAPIYAAIPAASDKALLELPFFGGTKIWSLPSFFNSIYVYGTRFHWNFLVNGRDSFAPLGHEELAAHAQVPEVFARENIEWLKRNHSLDYLVVNWEYLSPEEKLQASARMPEMDALADRVLESPAATVFRLREKSELTWLRRTYSAYHLRHRQLGIRLTAPGPVAVRVDVGGRFWRNFQVGSGRELRFRVDPGRIGRDCEQLTFTFSRPVLVDEIFLLKP